MELVDADNVAFAKDNVCGFFYAVAFSWSLWFSLPVLLCAYVWHYLLASLTLHKHNRISLLGSSYIFVCFCFWKQEQNIRRKEELMHTFKHTRTDIQQIYSNLAVAPRDGTYRVISVYAEADEDTLLLSSSY